MGKKGKGKRKASPVGEPDSEPPTKLRSTIILARNPQDDGPANAISGTSGTPNSGPINIKPNVGSDGPPSTGSTSAQGVQAASIAQRALERPRTTPQVTDRRPVACTVVATDRDVIAHLTEELELAKKRVKEANRRIMQLGTQNSRLEEVARAAGAAVIRDTPQPVSSIRDPDHKHRLAPLVPNQLSGQTGHPPTGPRMLGLPVAETIQTPANADTASVEDLTRATKSRDAEIARLQKQNTDYKNELLAAKIAHIGCQAKLDKLQRDSAVVERSVSKAYAERLELLEKEMEALKAKKNWWMVERSILDALSTTKDEPTVAAEKVLTSQDQRSSASGRTWRDWRFW